MHGPTTPQYRSLRLRTIDIVERLVDSGKFRTYRGALDHVLTLARKKRTPCGFEAASPLKSYEAYRKFKHRQRGDITEHE